MAKRQKGQNFERDICKKLSLWYGGRKDIFWRTAGSGARATVRMKQDKCTALSAGDIGCIDPIGSQFLEVCLIELKRGYSNVIDILACVDKLKSQEKLPAVFAIRNLIRLWPEPLAKIE